VQYKEFEIPGTSRKDLYVPANQVIYVAPELIVHYIDAHQYLPPQVFIDAVLACPEMRSMDYLKALLRGGGNKLLSQHTTKP
jgi:hypothetical protein